MVAKENMQLRAPVSLGLSRRLSLGRLGLGLALGLVLGLADTSRVAAQREVLARVIATADVDGNLGVPICDATRDLEPHPHSLYTYALVRQAGASDAPLVLDAGGLLGQGGVVRFAAEHDPDALTELVVSLGYDGLAFGMNELGTPRARMLPLVQRLSARGVPFIASNLRCTGPRTRALCEALTNADDAPVVVQAGRLQVAVLAMSAPQQLGRLDPELREGVALSPIADALAQAIGPARAAADLVVLMLDVRQEDALSLLEEVPAAQRPDLVVLADPHARLLMGRPMSITPAIVTPPGGDALEVGIREDRDVRVGVYEMIAQPLAQQGLSAGEPVLDFLDRIGPPYCDAWGRSLPGGRLTRAIDRAGLTTLVADFLREAVDADVAVLNRSLFDATFRPAHEDELTASDLYVGIEHDEPLYEAWVPREWLAELAGRREAQGLATPGLRGAGGETRVRGRPLVSRASYHVITTRYLTRPAREVLPSLPEGTQWRPVHLSRLRRWRTESDGRDRDDDPTLTVRELALRALAVRDVRDPREVRVSPDQEPEWVIQGFVDASFSGSSVDNPASYQAAQLNRSSTVTLGTEINLRADATAPDWTWENLGIFRYRTQWTEGAVTDGVRAAGAFTESVDQLQLRSTASYRGLRTPSVSEPWVPDPYVEVFVESELTVPAARMFHWLLVRPTLGARFPLTTDLELKLQTGLEAQVLQPGNEAEWGVGSVLTLRPWDLLKVGDRRVQLQGLVDFFFADPGDANRWQLRATFDALLDLAGPLAITFGVRAYLQQERGSDIGFALDATAGVRMGTLTRAIGP